MGKMDNADHILTGEKDEQPLLARRGAKLERTFCGYVFVELLFCLYPALSKDQNYVSFSRLIMHLLIKTPCMF